MIDRVIVEADGGSRGNPGPAGYGAVVIDPADGQILAERYEYIGSATNNVAEYRGLIAGLQAALDIDARAVDVRMDSRLVIEQTSGRWQVKHPAIKPLAREAVSLLSRFQDRTLEWIPRAQNIAADRLANRAMDEAGGRGARPPQPDLATADPTLTPASWVPASAVTTRVLWLRHGSTAHSPDHRMSGRNDEPLSPAGRSQVKALAQRLGRLLPAQRHVRLVCSPLRRSVQTANVIADAAGLEITTDDDLAELDFGAWEGRLPAELAAGWPAELKAWTEMVGDPRPPGGESIGELARRVRRARDRLIAAQPDGLVLAVSHVTPIKLLVQSALGAPPSSIMRMFLTPASITEIRYPQGGAAILRTFNDRAHVEQLPDY